MSILSIEHASKSRLVPGICPVRSSFETRRSQVELAPFSVGVRSECGRLIRTNKVDVVARRDLIFQTGQRVNRVDHQSSEVFFEPVDRCSGGQAKRSASLP